MIKLIAFDLDGVLVNTKEIHYSSLNLALKEIDEVYTVSWEEHLSIYDGLKTRQKLEILTKKKLLPEKFHDRIWKRKQEITQIMLSSLKIDKKLEKLFQVLKEKNFFLACCSNSVKETIDFSLEKLNIARFFDLVLSNEQVASSKPHPEIYWHAMIHFKCLPEETLIVEDSPAGLLSAQRSGAHVLRIKNPDDLTLDKVSSSLKKEKMKKNFEWVDERLNVLIPMAGAGSRFEKAGYSFPKPLIEVNKKPMIQVVVENLNIKANYIYVVQKSHRKNFNLDHLLNLLTPNCNIIDVEELTEGAACTALLAKDFINNENPLFFANSDQYVEWDSNQFLYKMQETQADGGIVTFKSTHPKWSFVKINESGFVTEVAEKKPISDNATVGYYFWKKGKDFVTFAESMIEKNIRVNNEFYVCPVFNQAIQSGKKIVTYEAQKMWGLGTPEDLQDYFKNFEP